MSRLVIIVQYYLLQNLFIRKNIASTLIKVGVRKIAINNSDSGTNNFMTLNNSKLVLNFKDAVPRRWPG